MPKWCPKNYEAGSAAGPSTLRFGIEKSRNLMTVRLANDMGMPIIVEYARRFGVYDNLMPMLSMALGAFLGGVLLAESEYRHEIEAAVEPFKGLLLGLFFIAVGMSVDFAVLITRPYAVFGLIAGLLLGLVLAMAIELRDGVVRENWQVETVIDLPVLCSIPAPELRRLP